MGKVLYNTYRKKRALSTIVLITLFISTIFNGVVGVAAEIQRAASGENEWSPWQPLSAENYGLTSGNDGVSLEGDGGNGNDAGGLGQGPGDGMLGVIDTGMTTAQPFGMLGIMAAETQMGGPWEVTDPGDPMAFTLAGNGAWTEAYPEDYYDSSMGLILPGSIADALAKESVVWTIDPGVSEADLRAGAQFTIDVGGYEALAAGEFGLVWEFVVHFSPVNTTTDSQPVSVYLSEERLNGGSEGTQYQRTVTVTDGVNTNSTVDTYPEAELSDHHLIPIAFKTVFDYNTLLVLVGEEFLAESSGSFSCCWDEGIQTVCVASRLGGQPQSIQDQSDPISAFFSVNDITVIETGDGNPFANMGNWREDPYAHFPEGHLIERDGTWTKVSAERVYSTQEMSDVPVGSVNDNFNWADSGDMIGDAPGRTYELDVSRLIPERSSIPSSYSGPLWSFACDWVTEPLSFAFWIEEFIEPSAQEGEFVIKRLIRFGGFSELYVADIIEYPAFTAEAAANQRIKITFYTNSDGGSVLRVGDRSYSPGRFIPISNNLRLRVADVAGDGNVGDRHIRMSDVLPYHDDSAIEEDVLAKRVGWVSTSEEVYDSTINTQTDGSAKVVKSKVWYDNVKDTRRGYNEWSSVVWEDPQLSVINHVDEGLQFEIDTAGYFPVAVLDHTHDATNTDIISGDLEVVPLPLWEIAVLLGNAVLNDSDPLDQFLDVPGVYIKVYEQYLENGYPEEGSGWDDEFIRTYELYIDHVKRGSYKAIYPMSEYRERNREKIPYQIRRINDRWVVSSGEADFTYSGLTVPDPIKSIYISNWVFYEFAGPGFEIPASYGISPLTVKVPDPEPTTTGPNYPWTDRENAWNPAVYPSPSSGEPLQSDVAVSYNQGPMETVVTLNGPDANFDPDAEPTPYYDTVVYRDDAALMENVAAKPIAFRIDTQRMNASLPPTDTDGTFVLSDYQISLNGLFTWDLLGVTRYPYYVQVSDSVVIHSGQMQFWRRIDLCAGGFGVDQIICRTWNQSYTSLAQMAEIRITISKNSSFYIFDLDGNLFVDPSYGFQSSETLLPGIFSRAFYHYNPYDSPGGDFAPSYRVRGPLAMDKTDPANPFYTGGERDDGILNVEKGDIALLSGTEITPFHLLSRLSGEPVKLRGTTDGNQLTFPNQRIEDVANTSAGLVIDSLSADSNTAGTPFEPGAVMALSFTGSPQPFAYANKVPGASATGNIYNNVYGGKEFFRITLEINNDQGVRITPTPGEHRNVNIPLQDLIPGYQPGDPIVNLPLRVGLYRPTPTSNDLFVTLNRDMLIKMDIAADHLGEELFTGPKYLSIAAWPPNNSGNVSWLEMTVEEIDGKQLCFLETAVTQSSKIVGDVQFNPQTGAYTFRRNQDGSVSYVQTNVCIPTPRNGTEAEIQFERDAYVGNPPSNEDALMVSFAFTGTADGYGKMLSGEDGYGIYVEVYVLSENKLLIRAYTYYKGADGAAQRQQIGTDQTLIAENGTNLVQELARIKVDIQFEEGDPSPLNIMGFANTMGRRSPMMPMATGRTPTMWISVNNNNVVSHQEDYDSGTAYAQVVDQVYDQNMPLYATLAVRNAAEDTNGNLVELSVVSIDNKRVEFMPPVPEVKDPAPGNTGRTPSSYPRVPNQVILPLETPDVVEEAVTTQPRTQRTRRNVAETGSDTNPWYAGIGDAVAVEPVVSEEPEPERPTTMPWANGTRMVAPDTGVRNIFEPIPGPQVGPVNQTPSNLGVRTNRPVPNPPEPDEGILCVRAREGSGQIVRLGDFELYADIPERARLADGEGMVRLEADGGNRGIALYKIAQDLAHNGIDVRVDSIPGFDAQGYDPVGDDLVIGMLFSDRNVNVLKPAENAWRGFAVYLTPLSSDEVLVEVYENANGGMVRTDSFTQSISVRPGADISLYAGIKADNTWTLYVNGHDHALSFTGTDRYTFNGSNGYISLYAGSNYPGAEPFVLTLLGMNGSFIFTEEGKPTATDVGLTVGGAVNALSRLTLYRPLQVEDGDDSPALGINLNLVLALSSCTLLGAALVTMKPWQGPAKKEIA